jgi:hypothetical protein
MDRAKKARSSESMSSLQGTVVSSLQKQRRDMLHLYKSFLVLDLDRNLKRDSTMRIPLVFSSENQVIV